MLNHLVRFRTVAIRAELDRYWWRDQELRLGIDAERIIWPKCFLRVPEPLPEPPKGLYFWNVLAGWIDTRLLK